MNGIQSALGQQIPEQKTDQTLAQGMGLPTPGDSGEGNPLEKMDQLSKQTPEEKKKNGTSLNSDVLESMLMTGDNKNGMFTPEVPDEIDGVKVHEDQDEKAKAKIEKGTVEPQGKYKESFKKDFLKNPEDYKIQTPKGEMTVAEAMRKGYDPLTKTFHKEKSADAIKEKHLSKLNDADRASIEPLLNPEAAQIAPADAAKYGLKEDSPFVKQPPEQQAPMPTQPVEPVAQGVGAPMQEPAQESQAPGAQGLEALLGQGGNV